MPITPMQAVNIQGEKGRRGPQSSSQGVRRRSRPGRHYSTVLDAEVARLVRELRATGPMSRDALARVSGSSRWREGGFKAAVKHGIVQGKLRELPCDFLAAPNDSPVDAQTTARRP